MRTTRRRLFNFRRGGGFNAYIHLSKNMRGTTAMLRNVTVALCCSSLLAVSACMVLIHTPAVRLGCVAALPCVWIENESPQQPGIY
jgi:hypothetical protein